MFLAEHPSGELRIFTKSGRHRHRHRHRHIILQKNINILGRCCLFSENGSGSCSGVVVDRLVPITYRVLLASEEVIYKCLPLLILRILLHITLEQSPLLFRTEQLF